MFRSENGKCHRMITMSLIYYMILVSSIAILAASVSASYQINSNDTKSVSQNSKDNNDQVIAPVPASTRRSQTKNFKSGRVITSSSSRRDDATTTTRSSSARLLRNQLSDPVLMAQHRIRSLIQYNNTPPVFVLMKRDFFIDVSTFPPGSRLTTMQAIDLENDQLEFSLKPAPLRDASSYFWINSTSGELRLATDKQFHYEADDTVSPLRVDLERGIGQEGKEDGEEREDEDRDRDRDRDRDGEESREDEREEQIERSFYIKNLYFLIVEVYDGTNGNSAELQIHVTNSTWINLRGKLSDNHQSLTPEMMENIQREKTRRYFNRLHQIPLLNNSTIMYPDYVNPGLSIQQQQDSISGRSGHTLLANSRGPDLLPSPDILSLDQSTIRTTESGDVNSMQSNIGNESKVLISPAPAPVSYQKGHLIAQLNQQDQVVSKQVPEPMMMSLIIICSCLMIALVLLMFIIPISVKKLRKRLKHVELQHEHLSQKTSNVSSSCSSTMAIHHHPSLSQFTLGSETTSYNQRDSSRVFRQSSLDSTTAAKSPSHNDDNFQLQHHVMMLNQSGGALNRVNNGSIANPMYLQGSGNFNHSSLCDFLAQQNHQQHYVFQQPQPQPQPQPQQHQIHGENVYYPLDDEFYSTIQTESTALAESINQAGLEATGYEIARCEQPEVKCEERSLESPGSNASSSSLRSLTRFLSLPARHQSLQQQQQPQDDSDNFKELMGLDLQSDDRVIQFTSTNVDRLPRNFKTIARSCQIDPQQGNATKHCWELERHKLRVMDLLDEGQFGQVWRCKLRDGFGSRVIERVVAVKSLKKSTIKDDRGREELLAEIEIMKIVCNHPNVVKILHCCTSDVSSANDKPILLIMEFVEQGKLQSYLEKSRINHQYATSLFVENVITANSSATSGMLLNNRTMQMSQSECLTSRDLMKFIYHVAKGMEYISSKCIVHRDLASRNILVSSQRICKIGDFGMARHMQSFADVYERHSGNSKIPVRWMAPEVLLSNSFTTKSDVFSFGILMWEIITLGSTPYTHLKTEQVIDRVAKNGERPEKPEYCHSQLYNIMSRCWSEEPTARPTFKELVDILGELVLSANNYIELDQYPDHDYYNIPKTAAPDELL